MAVKEESRVRCEEISYKQYTTSDGKVFLSKSEAEVHDGLLKWSDTVRNFGVKNTGGAYHGRAELDAAGFIRAEENDERTHIKKFVENFTFLRKSGILNI